MRTNESPSAAWLAARCSQDYLAELDESDDAVRQLLASLSPLAQGRLRKALIEAGAQVSATKPAGPHAAGAARKVTCVRL